MSEQHSHTAMARYITYSAQNQRTKRMEPLNNSELEMMEIIDLRKNRKSFLVNNNNSLQSLSIASIIARKKEICRAADATGINVMKKLAPTLRTSILEKLSTVDCGADREDFRLTCLFMALLVHKSTVSVKFPKFNFFQNELDFLASVADKIATEAPNVQRLCLGDRVTERGDIDLMAKSRFVWFLSRLSNLQVLDALAFHCDINSLSFIASNMTHLTDLRVSLVFGEIARLGQVFLPLRQLQHLQHFHFAASDATVTEEEVYFAKLCVRHLPKLKTVGRDLKLKLRRNNMFDYFDINKCDLVSGIDCVPPYTSCQLGLEEFACHAKSVNTHLAHRLPNLKRLHLKGRLQREPIPDTVSELHLYFNSAPWRLDAFSSRLRVLALYNCNLRDVPSNGLLAQCPNLEELHLHGGAFSPSNFATAAEMSHCKLLKLSLNQVISWRTLWNGLLCLLLQAPLLESVQICTKNVPIAEVYQLVEQVRSGRILQRLSHLQICGNSVRALQLAVHAFCPKVVHVKWSIPRDDSFTRHFSRHRLPDLL